MYGPKFGLFDTSIFIPLVIYPIIFGIRAKIFPEFKILIYLILILIIYQFIVQILNYNIDLETNLRLIRTMMVVIVIGMATSANNLRFNRDICSNVFIASVAHAFLIVAAAHNIFLNEVFSNLSGNDRVREYRSSGLLAGFDIAGFLSIAALVLVGFKLINIKNKLIEITCVLVLFYSCYIASRVSVAVAFFIVSYYVYIVLRNSDLKLIYRLSLFSVLLVIIYRVGFEAFLVFEVTMSLGLADVPIETAEAIIQRSAAQDPDAFLWSHMLFLPNSPWHVIFGMGLESLDSDIGYVKEIFRVGVIGLIIVLFSHVVLVVLAWRRCKGESNKNLKNAIVLLFLVMLLLTFKNNYLFVRGVTPLFLLMVAYCLTIKIKSKN